MRIIKRLYLFILNSFLPLFAMTFFIVLFIVLMQFLYRFIDDLVGKGLSFALLGELFFYAALSMVPMALPLAILLASLMTFGNFGEKFELTAMKASGISLLKAMSPLIVLISGVAVGAFFFQNDVLPKAQVKMWTLLFSIKQKSPELEIPAGVFYDQIPGYNLYVRDKNPETGLLYNVVIYDVNHGGDNSTVLTSDSARLAFTPDMRYLYLHLYQGEQFENLRDQSSLDRNVPFRREKFLEKEVLIPFDANFNRLDEGGMRSQWVGKNIAELRHTIDSVSHYVDSVGTGFGRDLKSTSFPMVARSLRAVDEDKRNAMDGVEEREGRPAAGKEADSVAVVPVDIDSLLMTVPPGERGNIFTMASGISRRQVTENQFRSMTIADSKKTIRRHEIEMIKKYTLSVACLIFFFIGAPLGAIIRKGGLGTPLVISVLLFLVYYIIDNTGYKMARDGHWMVWFGIWLSTFVLAPLGIYVTYKAMNDSAVFDPDRIKSWFGKILGKKQQRSVAYKEVIMEDFSTSCAIERLTSLDQACRDYIARYPRRQGYKDYWLHGYDMGLLAEISESLEQDVEYMTNCSDLIAVNKLMDYPLLRRLWVYHPSNRKWLSWLMICLFPIGLPIYIWGLRCQRNLHSELEKTSEVSRKIVDELTSGAASEGISE